jgi:hypothetical protein
LEREVNVASAEESRIKREIKRLEKLLRQKTRSLDFVATSRSNAVEKLNTTRGEGDKFEMVMTPISHLFSQLHFVDEGTESRFHEC